MRYSAAGEQLHNKEANRREIKRQPIELLQMVVCEQENTHHNPAEAAKPGAGEVKWNPPRIISCQNSRHKEQKTESEMEKPQVT